MDILFLCYNKFWNRYKINIYVSSSYASSEWYLKRNQSNAVTACRYIAVYKSLVKLCFITTQNHAACVVYLFDEAMQSALWSNHNFEVCMCNVLQWDHAVENTVSILCNPALE